MTPVSICPDTERFQLLLGGQLTPAEVSFITDHLESCPTCIETVAQLSDDTLTSALRNATHTIPDAKAERVEQIVLQCQRGMEANSPNVATDTATAANGVSDAEPVQNELGFLSPPQEAGEIGRLNGYRVLKLLGHGGMGMVLEAIDMKLKRRVALKVMKPEVAAKAAHRQRFVREAQAAATVEHDNIVPIFQVGEENGVPFIAMPFLKGTPLDARLKSGPLSITEIISIGRQTALGLAEAHAHGLIHRDIKPGNLWLEKHGEPGALATGGFRVKILDFGLARLATTEGEGNLTQSGAILGTPAYMAPEQARGESVDHRADLFGLGCVLYEMATERKPFRGLNTMAVLTSLAVDQPPLPSSINPNLPPALTQLIVQLLEKNPQKRPANAAVVADALRKMQPDTTVVLVSPLRANESASPWAGIDDDATNAGSEGVVATAPADANRQAKTKKPLFIALSLLLLIGAAFGAYQLVFKTKDGTLIVEVAEDADVRFKNGELHVFDSEGKLKYRLKPSDKNASVAPGDYKVQVVGADGLKLETAEFKMENNGKASVKVTVEKKESGGFATDRKAAESILTQGGKVTVYANQKNLEIGSLKELPSGDVQLLAVNLNGNKKATDRSLVCLKDLSNLWSLDLSTTRITDTGLVELGEMQRLRSLILSSTSITDAGLAQIKQFPNLATLYLEGTQITDQGVGHLKGRTGLTKLGFYGTRVGDDGIAQLADCRELTFLDLTSTRVSDKCVEILKSFSHLELLGLAGTKLSAAGIAELQKALPQCKIEWDGGVIEPKVSPDRKAAEYVRSIGGGVHVIANDKQLNIPKSASLPPGPFTLSHVDLPDIPWEKIRLENLKGLNNLIQIAFGSDTPDAALAEVAQFKSLINLSIGGQKFTGTGLRHIEDLKQLQELLIANSSVSDDALVSLRSLPNLWHLSIHHTGITDAGLKYLDQSRKLTRLNIGATKVTDKGMEDLKHLTALEDLEIGATKISDAALIHLEKLTNLQRLQVAGTQVTPAGVKKLAAALPQCKIEWDGGVIEPKVSPDRKAAEYLLSIGSNIRISENGKDRDIKAAGELPKGTFELTVANLNNNPKVSDAGLANFKDCKNIKVIDLQVTAVTDAGLVYFKDCKQLESLLLSVTTVTGAGLSNFKDCKDLRTISLGKTQITNAGLGHFKDLKNLGQLSFRDSQVSDAGLANFKTCKELLYIDLGSTQVTDDGLVHFKDCKYLERLDLSNTQVSDAGLVHLKVHTNLRGIELDNTKITEIGLAQLKGCKDLTRIGLRGTQLSDSGLAGLGDFKNLTDIALQKTKVTADGIDTLKKVLPNCKIEWDGGVIEAK